MVESSPPKNVASCSSIDSSVDELCSLILQGLMTHDELPDCSASSASETVVNAGKYEERCSHHLNYNPLQSEISTSRNSKCLSNSSRIFPTLGMSENASDANRNEVKNYTRIKSNKNNSNSLTPDSKPQDDKIRDLDATKVVDLQGNNYNYTIQNKTFNIDTVEDYNSNKTPAKNGIICEAHNCNVGDESHNSTTSFHTALIDLTVTGGLDDTVVSFPKLHPWTVKSYDDALDDTVVDMGR